MSASIITSNIAARQTGSPPSPPYASGQPTRDQPSSNRIRCNRVPWWWQSLPAIATSPRNAATRSCLAHVPGERGGERLGVGAERGGIRGTGHRLPPVGASG